MTGQLISELVDFHLCAAMAPRMEGDVVAALQAGWHLEVAQALSLELDALAVGVGAEGGDN